MICELDTNSIQNYYVLIEGFNMFNKISRIIIDLYNFIRIFQHNLKQTCDIRVINF